MDPKLPSLVQNIDGQQHNIVVGNTFNGEAHIHIHSDNGDRGREAGDPAALYGGLGNSALDKPHYTGLPNTCFYWCKPCSVTLYGAWMTSPRVRDMSRVIPGT